MPFLGGRLGENQAFQYLILDLSLHGARIAQPKWLLKRELLREGDRIDFHLPFVFSRETFDQGRIVRRHQDPELDAMVYGIRLDTKHPPYYPVYISYDQGDIALDLGGFSDSGNVIEEVLRDCVLLKRGILVYLKHLAPLLSRMATKGKTRARDIRDLLFTEARNMVEANRKALASFHQSFADNACRADRLAACFDLEDLRRIMEPEIEIDVWRSTLDSEAMNLYLDAVHKLQKRLFYNYNTMVMLYVKSL